jgi:hypothetical protein
LFSQSELADDDALETQKRRIEELFSKKEERCQGFLKRVVQERPRPAFETTLVQYLEDTRSVFTIIHVSYMLVVYGYYLLASMTCEDDNKRLSIILRA